MKLRKTKAYQGLTQSAVIASDTEPELGSSEFKAFLDKSIQNGSAEPSSEQEIFSSLVQHQVRSKTTEAAIEKFEERLERHREILAGKAALNQELSAAKFALRDLVRTKLVTKEDASKIYSIAFNSAQQDSDIETLSSKGVPNLRKALDSADQQFKTLSVSGANLTLRNLGESTRVTGAGGYYSSYSGESSSSETGSEFSSDSTSETESSTDTSSSSVLVKKDSLSGVIFSPLGSTGNLEITLPAKMSSQVVAVLLKEDTGDLIEKGKKIASEDGRAVYRCSKPGENYSNNITLELRFKDGTKKDYFVSDPSLQYG